MATVPETYDLHQVVGEERLRDDSFVWVVEAPEARPIFNPFDVFGDDAIPSMLAAAAAKPVGGTIEEGEATTTA